MPIQGYTPNKNLAKTAQNSTDSWDVWSNQNLDTLDEPVLVYAVAAAENLSAGNVAVIKDDGTGAKKAYLATVANYTTGDPLGIAMDTASAGSSVRMALDGRVQNAGWSFGPSDKFVYLSNAGTVTTTQTSIKIGFVLSATTIYFTLQAPPGGQTDTVTGANGLQNTGDNVNAVIAPVYGSTANTVCQGNDARLHAQNTDGGTSSASFEINYTANSARILTTGLTANRDYTLPDGTTKLVGESLPAVITAQHSFSPASAQAPFALGANAQGQLVTGLNADKLDGSDASAFATSGHNHDATYAPIAKGVTNGDSHDHADGDGAQIPLSSGVTGTLPIANGGTGQATANAALNSLLPSQTGKSGNALLTDGSNTAWASIARANSLINGEFDVWQRGTSFTGASGVFTADRWYVLTLAGSTTFTISRQSSSAPEGFSHSLRAQRNSGAVWTDQLRIGQALVTLDSVPMANKTVTFSFWAKKGTDYSAASYYLYSNIQEGRGADQSAATAFTSPSGWTSPSTWSQANVLTTSWQRFAYTFTINSLTTQLGFFFAMIPTGTAGANDWFEIAGIKVEIGSVATEFEREPFSQTLAKCQRYYQKTFPQATPPAQNGGISGALSLITPTGASGTVGYDWRFNPPMRIAPAIITYNPSAANSSWRDATNSADRTVGASANLSESACLIEAASTVGGAKHYIHATASAEL